MTISERIKRLWAPARPDHPLSEEEREQWPKGRYDTLSNTVVDVMKHGDPNIRATPEKR